MDREAELNYRAQIERLEARVDRLLASERALLAEVARLKRSNADLAQALTAARAEIERLTAGGR
jgi:hypothetical protein